MDVSKPSVKFSSMKRGRQSLKWKHFERYENGQVNCLKCNKTYANMVSAKLHFKNVHFNNILGLAFHMPGRKRKSAEALKNSDVNRAKQGGCIVRFHEISVKILTRTFNLKLC